MILYFSGLTKMGSKNHGRPESYLKKSSIMMSYIYATKEDNCRFKDILKSRKRKK